MKTSFKRILDSFHHTFTLTPWPSYLVKISGSGPPSTTSKETSTCLPWPWTTVFSWMCVWVIQSHPALCDSMNRSPPGSSVWILEWVAIPFSRGSSQPRNQIQVSCPAGRFFPVCTTRKVPVSWIVASQVCPNPQHLCYIIWQKEHYWYD